MKDAEWSDNDFLHPRAFDAGAFVIGAFPMPSMRHMHHDASRRGAFHLEENVYLFIY